VQQPFDPFQLNHRYASRAADIFAHYNPSAPINKGKTVAPFFLYVAFAHTHTPLAYNEQKFGNASSRPGFLKVFGNTLAELDDAVGQIYSAIIANSLEENTLIVSIVRRSMLCFQCAFANLLCAATTMFVFTAGHDIGQWTGRSADASLRRHRLPWTIHWR
jgi:hypothetical protein